MGDAGSLTSQLGDLLNKGLRVNIELRLATAEALARDGETVTMTKKEAGYDDGPNESRRCSDCEHWRGAATTAKSTAGKCSIVRGRISPDGTCDHYDAGGDGADLQADGGTDAGDGGPHTPRHRNPNAE